LIEKNVTEREKRKKRERVFFFFSVSPHASLTTNSTLLASLTFSLLFLLRDAWACGRLEGAIRCYQRLDFVFLSPSAKAEAMSRHLPAIASNR
jgi:hypothetical protein